MNYLIKSADRMSGITSNFTMYSKQILEGSYLVKNIVIANSLYNVNESNNKFILNEGTVDIPVEIPIGNYSVTTLQPALSNVLTAAGTRVYTASINSLTSKLTISNDTSGTFYIAGSSLLGIDSQVLAHPVVGTSIVNLGYPQSLGIQIQQSNTNGFENLVTDTCGTIYVPMNISFGAYETIPSIDLPQYVKFQRRDRHLDIRVFDTSTNETVDLNGIDFEILLSKCVRP